MRLGLSFVFLFLCQLLVAQTATIKGTVLDSNNRPFEPGVQITYIGATTNQGTVTNFNGDFELKIPAERQVIVVFSHASVKNYFDTINLKAGQVREYNIQLSESNMLGPINVVAIQKYDGIQRVDPTRLEAIVVPGGDLVSGIVKMEIGVRSTNEMSSQYSVRGGNFDENLVYINGIEVYRPVLVRAGQQEGLPIINGSLVKNINFSAGGFDAYYGDKMSSVLDIEYRKPNDFGGSFYGSLLGGGVHVEDTLISSKMDYLVGVRYKTNAYLLNSLETTGDYTTQFVDVQALLNYYFTEKFSMSFLGNYGVNNYQLVPEDRETDFGSIFEALRLQGVF